MRSCVIPPLRGAKGSRECAPDERLRDEPIHSFCAAMDCFAELPRHPNSAPFHAASTAVSNVNRGLVGAGAALHVIDEGSQLRHYLPVAGIIEKHANRQQFRQFMHLHRFEGWLGCRQPLFQYPPSKEVPWPTHTMLSRSSVAFAKRVLR